MTWQGLQVHVCCRSEPSTCMSKATLAKMAPRRARAVAPSSDRDGASRLTAATDTP
jgi:hypothetical protein